KFYTTPVIGVDGTIVIADSSKRVTAYDLVTGNEKWHHDMTALVAATPTLLPSGINYVYIASYDHVTKLDLDDGQLAAEQPLNGPVDAAPAAGGQYLFISTYSGVYTYDLNLKLTAFKALAGGRSAPAIGPHGEVYVASTDGLLYVFAGP